MLQIFVSLEFPDSDARSSRIALKDDLVGKLVFDDLVGKLVFDDPQVFKRLALDCVSPQFIADCAQAFTTDQDLLDARRELDKIIAAAIGRPVEELETDDEVHESFVIRKVKKKIEGKKMYKPLARCRSSQSRGLLTIIRNIGPYFNMWKFSRIRLTFYQNILSSLQTWQF
jgi:hypothetical protein